MLSAMTICFSLAIHSAIRDIMASTIADSDIIVALYNEDRPPPNVFFRILYCGDRVFPAFERILKKDDRQESSLKILNLLRFVGGDRSRFVKYTVRDLAHHSNDNRTIALSLLAQIGSANEASAVVALLSDEEVTVAFEAGDCLVAIGTERELIAFDITLRAELAKGKNDRDWLKTKRDKLKERLDREKAASALKAIVPVAVAK